MKFRRIAILGSGAMGTALAVLFAKQESRVTLWARNPDHARAMTDACVNARHLPGVALPSTMLVTADAEHAAHDSDLIVCAIPSAFLRSTLRSVSRHVPAGVPSLSAVKGIEENSFARPSEVIVQSLGPRPVSILSGPSHAEEIARGLPASVVVAGGDGELNRDIQECLSHDMFRIYTNTDGIGVELAGALKNILGIAVGICEGLGFGDNAKAALITRGLAEMARFACAQGARTSTFLGLAGVGDVVTTCFSPYGRNRSVGLRIGRGETLQQILASMTNVAEGVTTTRGAMGLAQSRGIELPITTEVHRILFENKSPRHALRDLMVRPPKVEWNS